MRRNRLKDLKLREVSLVKRGANSGARVILFKSEEPMNPIQRLVGALNAAFTASTKGTGPDGTVLKSEDEQQDVIAKQMDVVAEVLASTEEVSKAEDEAIAKAEEAIAKAEALEARLNEVTKQLDVAKAEKADAEVQSVAKALLGAIPGDPTQFAAVLKALPEAERTTLREVLTAANAALQTAPPLTEPLGKSGGTCAPNDLEARKKEVKKAFPSLTDEQAVAKALADSPDLYELSLVKES
jgi:acetolactate synthase small subunit